MTRQKKLEMKKTHFRFYFDKILEKIEMTLTRVLKIMPYASNQSALDTRQPITGLDLGCAF